MKKCIFCEILNSKLQASVVVKEERFTALMDIHPVNHGHVLIIPNRHITYLHDLTEHEQTMVMNFVVRIQKALQLSEFSNGDSNLLINDGRDANQHIPHLHIHIIPRKKNDTLKVMMNFGARMMNFFGGAESLEKLNSQAESIRKVLPQKPLA
ncbi:MAG: HIT family protein [Leptospiraceae bacterium]|nr:HIT family protein [Leptospiraceae bacterium]MCP5493152.1 HIT family protein [Leptospiraceae bacterium]